MLPLRTLSLAARNVLPLAFFYTAGRVVHDLVLLCAVYVGDVAGPRKYLGFAVMSLAVLATLAAYVAMLRVLTPQTVDGAAEGQGRDRLGAVIAHTLLPFIAFYGAWGLFAGDVQQYSILAQELFGVQQIKNLEFDPLVVTSAIAAAAFGVRVAFEKAYERTRKALLGLLTTVFESMWMFFAVVSVEVFISARVDWVTSRAAWVGARDAVGAVLGPVGDAVGLVLPEPKDALLMPLIWLTIAAVVYGRQMDSDAAAVSSARAERVWNGVPAPVRNAAEFVSRDLRGKYTPMLNGVRLVLRAGPIFFLGFCLCYVVLTVARDWAFIGVTRLAGPHDADWWTVWHGPIKFGVTAVYEVLRISLLAAAFQLLAQAAPAVRSRGRRRAAPRPATS
ncbi:hypothetical protein ACIBG8_30405 [Nonomuraea sp. NPDC050556]|uniref:hypothetical protein n=1 Tax=Nonomuraea sp. NPDC050556 TaxID=3364369 RepID=UPI0037889F20